MPRYSEKQKAALDTLLKNDLYEHALEILGGEGIGGLTMERLATEIGVSRATLYNYFVDKDAVIDYVQERAFEPVLTAIEQVAADDLEPELKLTQIASSIFTAVYDDSAPVISLPLLGPAFGSREPKIERKKQVLRIVEDIVRDGIESGVFRKLSPVVVAEAFVGSLTGMIESMAASGRFYRADAVVPTLMELYGGGLCTATAGGSGRSFAVGGRQA